MTVMSQRVAVLRQQVTVYDPESSTLVRVE
jgi:hypothetical protein